MPTTPPAQPQITRPLSLGAALSPIVAMGLLFAVGVATVGSSAELLVVVLLAAATVAGVVAVRHGASWDTIQHSTGEKLAAVLPAILILLAIGMLIATWVLSGTIPYLVYWGVRLIRPQFLVITAFLSTAIMSLFTGTSWGSAGTVGVALVGTATALDAPLGVVAGAVVSGAYFGDKMSPLSDTTNIAAIAARAPLYTHIRYMAYTAVPSFAAALFVYAAVGFATSTGTTNLPAANTLLTDLDRAFRLHWVALAPAVIIVWSIVRRVPPALAIAASALVAALLGIALQGFPVREAIVSAVNGFRLEMVETIGIAPAGQGAAFTTLVERGGLNSMAPTLVVIIAAFLLAGAMDAAGALTLLIERMLAAVRSVFGLVAATMTAGAATIALTSHQGVTALVIGGLFQPAYDERDLAPENLSRALEDSVTVTEPLMPWTVSGTFMATALGVPTLTYAPWAVFCYGGPIALLALVGALGRTDAGARRVASARQSAGDVGTSEPA